MELKTDCNHFPGNMPCDFNKYQGLTCSNCKYYTPVKFKILIVKLEPLGDVLRTTCLIPALKKQYPESNITWLTKKQAVSIFENNPSVNRVLQFEGSQIIPLLAAEKFDLVIHPDPSPQSAAIASYANSVKKNGYVLDEKGKVVPVNEAANEWIETNAFSQLKIENEKTYQQFLYELCGFKFENEELQIFLTPDEKQLGENFSKKHSISDYEVLIGLNTGNDSPWQFNKWSVEGYIDLVREIRKNFNAGIILYDGPEGGEQKKNLLEHFPDLIDADTDNDLREYFALLNLADVIVTSDTMTLHAASALKKKVVCLFGPTSFNEIEDYGRIEKVYPDMDCLTCYKNICDFNPSCMDLITVEMVYSAVEKVVKKY